MNKPPPKPDIGFQEALRRIANTPKSAIADKPEPKEAAPPKKRRVAKDKSTK